MNDRSHEVLGRLSRIRRGEREPAPVRVNGGLSFGGALALLFIGLRLAGVIDWAWVWVLSPLWLPVAVVLVFLAAVVCGYVATSLLKAIQR